MIRAVLEAFLLSFHCLRPEVFRGRKHLRHGGWRVPTTMVGGWPVTDSSYSSAGALLRSERTGGRQCFVVLGLKDSSADDLSSLWHLGLCGTCSCRP